jgi:DNA modification methylase
MYNKVNEICCGDCLELMKEIPDNYFDSFVTDPPYGLKFMGKDWDHGVPGEHFWKEFLRTAKPGAHLMAFGGTRTHHRLMVAIEDAGWEIRDCLMWVYGCLSEDTEILTINGWERYHKSTNFISGKIPILVYDVQKGIFKWEIPERWSTYRIFEDSCYRIQSDNTDQLVSRNHRCLVERDGKLVFVPAEELSEMEYMPTLPDNFFELYKGQSKVLFSSVQRLLSRAGLETVGEDWRCNGISRDTKEMCIARKEEPRLERWSDILQNTWKLYWGKIRSLPDGVFTYGSEGWICDGTPTAYGATHGADSLALGSCASYRSRSNEQLYGEFDAIQEQSNPQITRRYGITKAKVTQEKYTGIVFCPTVSTGAFVARRNGKVFITGNSGFPKSLDVSKAIDNRDGKQMGWFGEWLRKWRKENNIPQKEIAKLFPSKTGGITGCVANWELGFNLPTIEQFNLIRDTFNLPFEYLEDIEREVIGQRKTGIGTGKGSTPIMGDGNRDITTPRTDAAKQWSGWGTALKPAYEIIILARKPLDGTVAGNVQKWGAGALNIDGCRVSVSDNDVRSGGFGKGNRPWVVGDIGNNTIKKGNEQGRFPANLLHDGSDEVLALFPQTKNGTPGIMRQGVNNSTAYGAESREPGTPMTGFGDSGSAARFFKVCSYEDSDALLCSAKTKYINDILSVCDQNLVNTVDDNSTLSSQHAVSVLNRVVIEASQEGNQLKNIVGLSTSVTPLLLKHLCENAIELIVNSEQECLQGLYPIGMVKLNGNLARYAGIQRQTDTTTIIQNPTNLDGCAAVVMSITTKNNMALGEVGYLPRFKYCAKASKSERGFGNTHPTVKPLALMQYLVRLITPPNGIICDPFIGSGSTAIAAIKEGFNYIGMDKDQSSVDIANKRIFDNL